MELSPLSPQSAAVAAAPDTAWRTLPHEWAFSAMLLAIASRLALHAGTAQAYALLFFAYFVVGLGLNWWCSREPTPLRWRVRLLWYPTAMGLVFYTLPAAVARLQVPDADLLLQSADQLILDGPVAGLFGGVQSPLFTDLMTLAYLSFFYYLLAGPGYYCVHDLRRFRLCFVGLFTIYAVGLLSYTLLPAGGPHLAQRFDAPLPAGPLSRLALPLVNGGSNGIDVFPSIHVAVSAYLLGFDARHYPRRFRRMLLPVALLWLSTLYLRYHYLVDAAAGLLLAAVGLAVARLHERSRQARSIEAERYELPVAATR